MKRSTKNALKSFASAACFIGVLLGAHILAGWLSGVIL